VTSLGVGPTIPIPRRAVVVLVGAAGAGKSTFARGHFAADEILSSDDLRGAIRGDPADQSATKMAFAILHRELVKRLAAGRSAVIDATNLSVGARAAVVRRARLAAAPLVAIVLVPPRADVHHRNAGRQGGIVPPAVVDRQLDAAVLLGTDSSAIAARLAAEGFDAVHVLTSVEAIEGATILRTSG
jgi:predicted kinase